MVNIKHIWSPVVEQLTYKGSGGTKLFLHSTMTNYKDWGTGIIAPETVQTKTLTETSYQTRLRYHSYDNYGHVTTVSKENDIMHTYLWGYNNSYPVAEVIGVDYNTIQNAVNPDPNIIQNNSTDDQNMQQELNRVRQAFPSAQVTSYTYKPLIGMTSQTDLNGNTSSYEYDAFGRLSVVRGQDHKVLKTVQLELQYPIM
jgi:YD repeat-containing protein